MAADEEELGYHPDVIPEDEEQQELGLGSLYCFMDKDRPCGPECMAFITYPRSSKKGELNKQQEHCTVLVNTDRLGRHLTIVASVMSQDQRARRTEKADAKREAATPRIGFPDPVGNKSPFKGG